MNMHRMLYIFLLYLVEKNKLLFPENDIYFMQYIYIYLSVNYELISEHIRNKILIYLHL